MRILYRFFVDSIRIWARKDFIGRDALAASEAPDLASGLQNLPCSAVEVQESAQTSKISQAEINLAFKASLLQAEELTCCFCFGCLRTLALLMYNHSLRR